MRGREAPRAPACGSRSRPRSGPGRTAPRSLVRERNREPLDRYAIGAHRAKHGQVGIAGGTPVDSGAEGVCRHDDFLGFGERGERFPPARDRTGDAGQRDGDVDELRDPVDRIAGRARVRSAVLRPVDRRASGRPVQQVERARRRGQPVAPSIDRAVEPAPTLAHAGGRRRQRPSSPSGSSAAWTSASSVRRCGAQHLEPRALERRPPLADRARPAASRLARHLHRQLLVQGQHQLLLAPEVAIREPDRDVRLRPRCGAAWSRRNRAFEQGSAPCRRSAAGSVRLSLSSRSERIHFCDSGQELKVNMFIYVVDPRSCAHVLPPLVPLLAALQRDPRTRYDERCARP